MKFDWRDGNQARLLSHKNNYSQQVFKALQQAKLQVLFETTGLVDDPLSQQFCQQLMLLAERGVQVSLTFDARNASRINSTLHEQLLGIGVKVNFYRAKKLHPATRMHRRLLVIDQQTAFIGGSSFSNNERSPSEYDFAIELAGPIVADIQRLLLAPSLPKTQSHWWLPRYPEARVEAQGAHKGSSLALLLPHEDHQAHNELEQHLLYAIDAAQTRISIATENFCPTPELLSAILNAALRGVQVRLYLPTAPNGWLSRLHQSLLIHAFRDAGVQLYSYQPNALGSKVILIDQALVCIGSSNLDPQSLLRNLEADLLIRDHQLNQQLQHLLEGIACCELSQPRRPEQQGLGLSQLMLDSLYYLRRSFAPLDRHIATASKEKSHPIHARSA